MMNEEIGGMDDKVGVVKKFLDDNFARATTPAMGKNGLPETQGIVVWLDDNKNPVKTLTDVQLFYVVQSQFKNILADRDERDKFLKQVIKDWYNKKISNVNTLSLY
jgi:hypothetical protein